jgi:hypothetical protein
VGGRPRSPRHKSCEMVDRGVHATSRREDGSFLTHVEKTCSWAARWQKVTGGWVMVREEIQGRTITCLSRLVYRAVGRTGVSLVRAARRVLDGYPLQQRPGRERQ